jgi:hypothetical protein
MYEGHGLGRAVQSGLKATLTQRYVVNGMNGEDPRE